VEAKLSDALHARLTERFVNRRTTILMKSLGQDAALLPVTLNDDGMLCVEDEPIGKIEGFRFEVDPLANHTDRKMLLSAGEKALPKILGEKARALASDGLDTLALDNGAIWCEGRKIATIEVGTNPAQAQIALSHDLDILTEADRATLATALEAWLAKRLEPIAPLAKMEAATRDDTAGSQARAMLLTLIAGHGYISREKAGIEHLPKEMRPFLRRLGVTFGALDIFAPAVLKPAARQLLRAMAVDRRPLNEAMIPVIDGSGKLPSGYRPAGKQAIRIDVAEKLLKAAHETRAKSKKKRFIIDPSLAVSTGLVPDSQKRLLGAAGFRIHPAKTLKEGALGPPGPDAWEWRPSRRKPQRKSSQPTKPQEGNAFAGLADLMKS
jgi:ATP-dependent RNA helicase SUPV3L1/SUV3